MRHKKLVAAVMIAATLATPRPARADLWGADIPLLIQIVVNSIQQLVQLKSILGTGIDTLKYIEDINAGLRNAMNIMRTMNSSLSPGVLSQLQNAQEILGAVEQLYGRVPVTGEAQMQRTMDQSVAESIQLHNEAFKYAAQVDPVAEEIKEYAKAASPQAAEKVTAQALGVLIHVMNQILRTNAAVLKMQSEQLALQNRREKLQSEHFRIQYEGLAKGFGDMKGNWGLPRLNETR